jgi:hypothetical protein
MRNPAKIAVLALLCIGLGLGARDIVHAQSAPTSGAQYKYISGAATTIVKPAYGFLHTVTINGGTAGVVTLYDISGVGCTGTPASGKFATIETIGTTNPVTLTYDLIAQNGICVVTAAATDLTISFN